LKFPLQFKVTPRYDSKSSEQHSKFHGVWGIREASFGNNGRTKTGIILEQHAIQ
jgi:hypothetical protein